jgi:divinyl chlorophyllide a 8-vinyl-reductase
MTDPATPPATPRRIVLLGGTGTIGRATLRELLGRGHEVVALVRPGAALPPARGGLVWRAVDLADPAAVARDGLRGERFHAVVSCLASRNGAPADAWGIDHVAHRHALQAALAAGVPQWLQLSALCVQKPRLAFQHAKLAFEAELMAAPLDWTIVRPTAFFKSLSGQVERVRQGRPFLMFGDGTLTACKPIADEDLATYLADRLGDADSRRRVLPIGGPGDAITPRQQGERLFELLGRPPRFKSVPAGLLAGIAGALGAAARLWPPLQAKAELARIGHYYATESMLVWDDAAGRYDAAATPSTGTRTLFEHYAALLRGDAAHERGEHAVF